MKKVLYQRNQLMACRGAAKRDDLLVVDGRQDEEVGAEVHNGSQGPERIDAEEDWSHTLVQSVDLDLSIVASGCHSDLACAEAAPFRTIPKPKQWLVVLVHLGQASVAMFGLVASKKSFDGMHAAQRLGGTSVDDGVPSSTASAVDLSLPVKPST